MKYIVAHNIYGKPEVYVTSRKKSAYKILRHFYESATESLGHCPVNIHRGDCESSHTWNNVAGEPVYVKLEVVADAHNGLSFVDYLVGEHSFACMMALVLNLVMSALCAICSAVFVSTEVFFFVLSVLMLISGVFNMVVFVRKMRKMNIA